MRTLPLLLCATVAVGGALAACDVQKTGNQLQAQKIMVAAVLGTPPVSVDPLALSGFDAGFDAGSLAGLDGGAFYDPDAGVVMLPPQTLVTVFFGERDSSSFDTPPDPVTGATAQVVALGEAPVELEESSPGNYEANSQTHEDLEYAPGADYEFRIQHQGETYVGKVTESPQLEQVDDLHPPSGFIRQTAGLPFTFTRPEPPAGQARNLGFVNVFPISEDGERGELTYTNIPDTPLEFLELVARPGKWREAKVTVPGTAFPEAGMTYLLILQAVKLGGPESDNVFTGSAILAGTAEVGVFRTE